MCEILMKSNHNLQFQTFEEGGVDEGKVPSEIVQLDNTISLSNLC